MTTMPTSATSPLPVPRREPAPAPITVGGGIDPVKLIMRNLWLLAGAGMAGAFIGAAAHFALLFVYPVYKPKAVFECNSPVDNPYRPTGAGSVSTQEELQTFMQTQVRIMTSDEVLERVARSPRLAAEAPNWIKWYLNSDGTTDQNAVFKELQDEIRARTIPQTRLIELTFGWKKSQDAAGVVQLVMNEYMDLVRAQGDNEFKDQTAALSKNIKDLEDEIGRLKTRRAGIIRDKSIDSSDPRLNETTMRLEGLGRERLMLMGQKRDTETRISIREDQLNDQGGAGAIQIPEEIKSRVSVNPQILNIEQSIALYESELDGLRRKGMTPENRVFKRTQSTLEAYRQKLEQTRQELEEREFRAELELLRTQLRSVESQLDTVDNERKELLTRQTELTQTLSELNDIDDRIKQSDFQASQAREKLKELNAITAMPTANRIQVRTPTIRPPREPVFPRLIFLVPAGGILCLALVGGIVVLREVVDQRIKSPSDVTMLNRTTLLGWVADVQEDPSQPAVVETAFRDRPKGIIAENFRQLRSSLAKRIEPAGRKTILVAGCMPSSGTTSVVSNLALSFASAGKSVLVIDANLRRPALHKVFGVQDRPGLGEILAGEATLSAAAKPLDDAPGLSVIWAGEKEKRVYESLATEAMGKVLQEARGKYDIVLVDCSPAVVAGDANAIASRADASILVARAFSDKRGMVNRIKNELLEARGEFLGVVVDGVKHSAGGYLRGNIKAAHEYHNDPSKPAA